MTEAQKQNLERQLWAIANELRGKIVKISQQRYGEMSKELRGKAMSFAIAAILLVGLSSLFFGGDSSDDSDQEDIIEDETPSVVEEPALNNMLLGTEDDDTLESDAGLDTAVGGAGNDLLDFVDLNLEQSDVISGGAGNDVLRLDDGDEGTGGEGRDYFEVVVGRAGAEPVTITDLALFGPFDDTQDNPEFILFVTEDGEYITRDELINADLTFETLTDRDNETTQISFNGQPVAIVEGWDSFDLAGTSHWVGNYVLPRISDVAIEDIGRDASQSIFGAAGDDSLGGSAGQDDIFGLDGDDIIDGRDPSGRDPDALYGGYGDDTIYSDNFDAVYGGDGADLNIIANAQDSAVRLRDFEIGEGGDRIEFVDEAGIPLSRADVLESMVIQDVEGSFTTILTLDGVEVVSFFRVAAIDLLSDQSWIANT